MTKVVLEIIHPIHPQEVARMSLSLAAGCCVFSEEFGFGTIHAVHYSGNTLNTTYEVCTLFELFCAEDYIFSSSAGGIREVHTRLDRRQRTPRLRATGALASII